MGYYYEDYTRGEQREYIDRLCDVLGIENIHGVRWIGDGWDNDPEELIFWYSQKKNALRLQCLEVHVDIEALRWKTVTDVKIDGSPLHIVGTADMAAAFIKSAYERKLSEEQDEKAV